MSSGGKGGGTTTVTQDNEPPEWAQPLFEQSAGIAQDLYNSGAGFNPWPGSTSVQPSRNTMLGQQGLQNVALSPETQALGQNPVNLTNQVLSQGGVMAPSQSAMSFFGDVAKGGMNPGMENFQTALNSAYNPATMQAGNIYGQAGSGQFNTGAGDLYSNLGGQQIGTRGDYADIYGRAQQPGAAENYLGATARGDYIAEGNPYFRELLTNEAQRLGDQVEGMFSAGGRYGSGANQDVLGRTVGDFTLKGLSEDFNRERQAQMNAAQFIEQAQQGRLGQQLGAVGGMTGVEGQNWRNAFNAAQGIQSADAQNAGLALQGAGGLAGLGQNLFGNLMSGASNIYGAQNQNLQNQMNAAQSASNISNQGLQNSLGYINSLPTIQQNQTFAPQLLQQVGAQQDQASQAQLNDLISRYYQQDMAPWTRLGALQAAAQGSAGPYGTMVQQTQQPSNFNPLGLIGGAMQLATPFF